MATSKNSRLIYVHRWTLGSHERAEHEPMTIKCAKNYQPITNECAENYQQITNQWSLGTRGCAKYYFIETIFVENNTGVVVIRQNNTEVRLIPYLSLRAAFARIASF